MNIGVDFLADRLGQSGCIGFHRNFIHWISRFAENERWFIFVYDSEHDDYQKHVPAEKTNSVTLISLGKGDNPLWKRIYDQQVRLPLFYRQLRIERAFSDNVIPFWGTGNIRWFFRVIMTQQFHKDLDEARGRRIYRSFTTRYAVRKADRVLPNSQFTLRELKTFCRFRPNAGFRVIGEALDHQMFFPVDGTVVKDSLEREFSISSPYVLQVSGYYDHKNPVVSIKVLAGLRRRGEDIRLVLVGSDPRNNRLRYESIAGSLGVRDQVTFLPFQLPEKLRLLYNGARCFLYPSAWETFGIPPLEAMACGVPVVSSDRSSVPEVMGEAAIQIDPDDIEGTTSAVKKVLNDRELRTRMIERGLRHSRMFSWENIIRRLRQEIISDEDVHV